MQQTVQHRFDLAAVRLPDISAQTVYIKDVVVETFIAPLTLSGREQVTLQVYFDIANLKYDNNAHEVTLTTFAKTFIADKPLYSLEIKQAGIFDFKTYTSEQTHPLLGIACPQILYQYTRELADRLVQRAGYPPLFLPFVDFKIMYEDALKNAKTPN